MIVYAFVGPIKSGKDTTADILIEHGIANGKLSFAGPLKNICSKVFNIDINYFHNQKLKESEYLVIISHDHLRSLEKEMSEYIDNPVKLNNKHISKEIVSPRMLLQYVGTEIMREYDPDFHIKAAFSDKVIKDLTGIYCVTDARFVNEYNFLQNKFKTSFKGFYILRTEAEKNLGNHESELQILKLKKIISNIFTNDGTLDEYRKKVLEFFVVS